jgi:uncharacterized repeat protein (TIGR01451 family)
MSKKTLNFNLIKLNLFDLVWLQNLRHSISPTVKLRSAVLLQDRGQLEQRCFGRYFFLLFLTIAGYSIQPACAEGSKELTSQGGNRAFLLYHSASNPRPTIGSIPLRTIIKVYVNGGETINLGSSANGIGSGVINYRTPSGASGTCLTTVGRISNIVQEQAGPAPNAGGYTPCIITSAQTSLAGSGIWEIDFVSPNSAIDNNPAGLATTATWTQANSVGWVAAWDVTVRNSTNTGSPYLGRAYSNSLALRMPPVGASFRPLLYVQTQEGYLYQVNPRNLDPFTFAFFANNKGFKSAATDAPLYRSVDFPGGTGLEAGVTVADPTAADSGNNVTHKIFFNTPDTFLPSTASSASGSTWLLQTPVAPQPTNFVFVGAEGTAGSAGTSPLGGSFSFTSNTGGRFLITLDLDNDGIYGVAPDRVLSGFANIGTNTIVWDGKDSTGVAVSANASAYGSKIVLNAGEIHFPLLDAERNPSGLTIQRLNNPFPVSIPTPDPYLVYFNDTIVGGSQATNGLNSSAGIHSWTSDFGNNRGLDTWASYPSTQTELPGGVAIKEADLEVVSKTHTPTNVRAGKPIIYTVVVKNNGPSDVVNAQFLDPVPAEVTGVTWTCTVSPVATGNSCVASGTGNAIDTPLSLKNGATATYTVTGVASTTGLVTNTAKILRPNDVTDPNDVARTGANNNNKSDELTVTASVANVLLVKRITAINPPSAVTPLNSSNPYDGTSLNQFVANSATNIPINNQSCYWPTATTTLADPSLCTNNYTIGAIDAGKIKPGDTIEYTVYFVNAGGTSATSVKICDLLRPNQTYIPGSLRLQLQGGSIVSLTDADDTSTDRGQFVSASDPDLSKTSNCNLVALSTSNANGVVAIDITGTTGSPSLLQMPNATSAGTPAGSSGWFKFRTKVNN